MKKYIVYIFSILAVIASCSKEEATIADNQETVIETGSKTELISLVANSNEDEADVTKTSIGEGNIVLWQKGDALSILSDAPDDNNLKFSIKSGVGTSSATFEGAKPVVSDEDPYVYVCYPYNEGNALPVPYGDNSHVVKFVWNGAEQIATPGSFDPAKAPLFGCFENTEEALSNVTLKQVMAFVKITTDQRCQSIKLESNSEYYPIACGSFYLVKDDDGKPAFFLDDIKNGVDDPSTSITLTGKDGAIIEPGTYYVAVLPQTYTAGLTISFVSTDDTPYTLTKSGSRAITLKRKTITNFGKFTLPIEEFNFTGGGTAESPYKISTLVELKNFATLASQSGWASLKYSLAADIDCQGETLGVDSFNGTFDGCNHTISNYSTRQNGYSSGLFITVTDATIQNLTVNCNGIAGEYKELESASDTGNNYSLSPLVGSSYSTSETSYTTINNCTVTGSLTVNVPMINGAMGAIVGNVYDKIVMSGCTNNAAIKLAQSDGDYGTLSLGGLVGSVQGKEFETYAVFDRIRNNGKLVLNSTAIVNIGGIIGRVLDSPQDICLRLSNSVNSAELRTNEDSSKGGYINSMGGMVGDHDSDGWIGADPYIFNCLNKGKLVIWNNDACEGGIMGDCYDNDTKVTNCANIGEIQDIGRDEFKIGHGTMCGGQPRYFGSEFGYFAHCHWTNTQMVIVSVYNGTGSVSYYDEDYQSDCSYIDPLTAETMNPYYNCITLAPVAFDYCQWKGTSADGSLDLDF